MKKKGRKRRKISQGILLENEKLVLTIEDINHEGQGIGRQDGLIVFVPEAIPGDVVEIRIVKRLKSYAVGHILNRVKNSPDRVEPDCQLAYECGGCSLQMMTYAAQLRHKQNLVFNALHRIGKIANASDLMQPILGMDEPWHYRNKVQLPVAGSDDKPEIGFYASRSHDVVDATVCPVQPPVCDALREAFRQHLKKWRIEPYRELDGKGLVRHFVIRMGFFTQELMVIIVLNGDGLPGQTELVHSLIESLQEYNNEHSSKWKLRSCFINMNKRRTNVILGSAFQNIHGDDFIEEKLLGIDYRISPAAFFQVNPKQTEVLYRIILEMADLKGFEQVVDLYCGIGSISLLLAQRAGWVLGIEAVEAAVNDAVTNAKMNDIQNAEFVAGLTEDVLPAWIERGLQADLVVLDPPRKGCDQKTMQAIIELSATRVLYVSCNPATLARDLKYLSSNDYRVEKAQAIDLFPHTSHVETVCLLTRMSSI